MIPRYDSNDDLTPEAFLDSLKTVEQLQAAELLLIQTLLSVQDRLASSVLDPSSDLSKTWPPPRWHQN